ncbi:sugar phosphate isomerase/epimerase family protein [Candidatus Omnitrophota bacterium]
MKENLLAVSTTWNAAVHSDIKAMLSEIKAAEVDAIEIGYNFTARRLKELMPLIGKMGLRVVSMHNFCPLPEENEFGRFSTDYYRLSSLNKRERAKAVEHTKKTVDTARAVSCPFVIVHAGTVEMENNSVRILFQLYNDGKFNSQEYRKIKEGVLAERKSKAEVHLESAAKSLREVLSYASSAGIKIGLETRYYPNEIPNLEEAEYLLGIFRDKGLYYWHDVGHAETNQRLGITSHKDYLDRLTDYMAGIHLHDLQGIDDHLAPFSGDFDWSSLTAYMRDDLIKVIEAHQPATQQQIKEAVKRLSFAF